MVLTHGFDMTSKNYNKDDDDDNEYSRKYLSLFFKITYNRQCNKIITNH